MKTYLLLICFLFVIGANAQQPDADSISTNDGTLKIQPVTHASLILTLNDKTIFIDPTGGAESYKRARPDIIIITDIHGDHMDANTINAIKSPNIKIIAPRAVADSLKRKNIINVTDINNGESKPVDGITISAIPMYNLPEKPDSRHPKGRGNGYILEIGGKRIYISGDTEDISEMRELKNIDAAFVCMNLPYTMDIYQAVSAVLEFQPKIVYPYHYRGQNGLSDIETFKTLVNKENPAIDVRLLNWYPAK